MRKPSERTLKIELKKLRRIVENDQRSKLEQRIAYTLEHAIRWVTEETSGWPKPSADVSDIAKMIENDL